MDIPKQKETPDLRADSVAILNAVWNAYGHLTGDQLEALTHAETPWRDARGDLEPWQDCTVSISCSAMREYYGKKYDESNNA